MAAAPHAEQAEHGGVVFRVRSDELPNLFFLPASIAMKVMPMPEIARVPGAPSELRGVALVDGDMIPVVELGPHDDRAAGSSAPSASRGSAAMLVCAILGERLGLVGIDIVATGRFVALPEEEPQEGTPNEAPPAVVVPAVKYGDETARPFDVTDVIARVREGRWAV